MQQYAVPLLLTLLAGLATGIGSLLALAFKTIPPGVFRLTMGFSAGVMIYVSFAELLATGVEAIGFVGANIAFFSGMALIAAIDFLVPHNYLAEKATNGNGNGTPHKTRMMKAGLLTAFGLMIHNFPEGMAVFASAVQDPRLGVALAVAIAIHNIPEGIAVSMPIYAATGSRRQAFFYSFISGIAEPVGALLALLFLMPFLNEAVLGGVLAAVGGLMVFISFDEILPISYHHEEETATTERKYAHEAIIGVIAGMLVMAVSLGMF